MYEDDIVMTAEKKDCLKKIHKRTDKNSERNRFKREERLKYLGARVNENSNDYK